MTTTSGTGFSPPAADLARFRQLDTNKDGKLDANELAPVAAKISQATGQNVTGQQLLDKLDQNGDGGLQPGEMPPPPRPPAGWDGNDSYSSASTDDDSSNSGGSGSSFRMPPPPPLAFAQMLNASSGSSSSSDGGGSNPIAAIQNRVRSFSLQD